MYKKEENVIGMTVSELIQRHVWNEVCEMKGLNKEALDMRLISRHERFYFSEQEARKLGFWVKESNT